MKNAIAAERRNLFMSYKLLYNIKLLDALLNRVEKLAHAGIGGSLPVPENCDPDDHYCAAFT